MPNSESPQQSTSLTVERAFARAIAHHQAGELADAERLYRSILSAQPSHADANHNLGVIAKQRGRMELAFPHLKTALEANPANGQYWLSYAEVLLLSGQPADAQAVLQQGEARGLKGPQVDTLLVRVQQSLREMQDPLFPGISLVKAGKSAEAIAWLSDYVVRQPEDARALSQLGELLRHQNGRLDEAAQVLERAIKHGPHMFMPWLSYGSALNRLQRKGEAKAAFTRALEINPNLVEALNDLATIHMEEDHFSDASALLARACEIRPDVPDMHLNHARALARLKRFADAEAAARRALSVDHNDSSGARMFLASLGVERAPDRIPDALLHKLYDARAESWDAGANPEASSYLGASLVANAFLQAKGSDLPDVLDAGCGTGLVGALVRGSVRSLVGVDMSQPMLAKANEKTIYDSLSHGDMIEFMAPRPNSYDAIVSAATLIHFGPLLHIFESAHAALRLNGIFVFTIFPNDSDPSGFGVENSDGMAQGGCYMHGRDYVASLASETGFVVERIEREIHEYNEKEQPKVCFLVTLRACEG